MIKYLNKRTREDKLVNEIKKTYGEDSIMIFGDWSIGKEMKNFTSTPNLGLKKN